jgi:hypothetical protein
LTLCFTQSGSRSSPGLQLTNWCLSSIICTVGFEVLTAVSTKMAVFWVVAPSSLVEGYQRFRGPCCLHHQGDDRATTQKTAIFIVCTVALSEKHTCKDVYLFKECISRILSV